MSFFLHSWSSTYPHLTDLQVESFVSQDSETVLFFSFLSLSQIFVSLYHLTLSLSFDSLSIIFVSFYHFSLTLISLSLIFSLYLSLAFLPLFLPPSVFTIFACFYLLILVVFKTHSVATKRGLTTLTSKTRSSIHTNVPKTRKN